jgi:hypothetical protein
MPSIYFRVNDKIIFNHLLAKYESFVSKQPIEFVCLDEQYNQLNWLQEPTETIDQLMDSHAINLRNKHQTLILLWSGGTDSQTMYNVFKRNNIHLDEIIFFTGDEYEPWYTDKFVEWLKHNHYDPLTKITVKHRFDPVAKQQIINNEDWLFQNITLIPKMVMGTCDPVMWEYCAQQYDGSTWCLIIGLEQPKVFFKDGKYYSCQDSKYLLSAIGFENIECFYTEPLIALKQSHLIKSMLKVRMKINNQDLDGFKFKTSSNACYTAWQRGLGRHNEVLSGMSFYTKQVESNFEHELVNPTAIDGDLSRGYDRALDALLKKHNDMANVFVRGIKNLLLEKDFCDHLIETSTNSNKSLIGKSIGEPIYSKLFCIGE